MRRDAEAKMLEQEEMFKTISSWQPPTFPQKDILLKEEEMTLKEIKTKFYYFTDKHAITKADLCVKSMRERRGLAGPGYSYFVFQDPTIIQTIEMPTWKEDEKIVFKSKNKLESCHISFREIA